MRRYEYKISAFGKMRDKIADVEKTRKKTNKVPYKTIMRNTNQN